MRTHKLMVGVLTLRLQGYPDIGNFWSNSGPFSLFIHSLMCTVPVNESPDTTELYILLPSSIPSLVLLRRSVVEVINQPLDGKYSKCLENAISDLQLKGKKSHIVGGSQMQNAWMMPCCHFYLVFESVFVCQCTYVLVQAGRRAEDSDS